MSVPTGHLEARPFEHLFNKGKSLARRSNPVFHKMAQQALRLHPLRLLVLGYFLIVLVVALLLMLPVSNARGQSQPFLDALFMASSGISTTGLTVVDIGQYYSTFGQVILLIDFQVGGIGYMAFFVFLGYLFQINFSLRTHLVAQESVTGARIDHNLPFFSKVILFTMAFELAGAAVLSAFWMRDFPPSRAIYLGIFHAVSAFCTAGFCLFPQSLIPYGSSILVNAVVIILSLAGGIGFFVLNEIAVTARMKLARKRTHGLSTHSQLAILVTAVVIMISAAVIFFSETWAPELSPMKRLLHSSFQAISASTTDGFNTLTVSAMSIPSLFVMILLMLTGASPGGTGGGIKTTTLGALFLSIKAQLTGQSDANFLKRRIPEEMIRKSFSIFFLFSAVMITDLMVLATVEKTPFLSVLFEAASALGNTGLSIGITSHLAGISKAALSLTMFIGRVGPLTIGLALIGKKKRALFSYADGEVYVG